MGGAQANPTTPVVKRGWVGVTQQEGHVQREGGGIPPTCANRIEGRRGQRGLNPSPWDGQRRVVGFAPRTVRHDGRRWPIGLHKMVLKHHCFH